MAQLLHLPLLLLLLLLLVSATIIAESSSPSFDTVDWGLSHFGSRARGAGGLMAPLWTCNGLVGECMNQDQDEFMVGLDDVDVRRTLYGGRGRGRRYISYGALKRNQVPCKRRGQSYYGCGKASKVNPYRRGCSAITHCQRNIS